MVLLFPSPQVRRAHRHFSFHTMCLPEKNGSSTDTAASLRSSFIFFLACAITKKLPRMWRYGTDYISTCWANHITYSFFPCICYAQIIYPTFPSARTLHGRGFLQLWESFYNLRKLICVHFSLLY